jgi:Tfp pilus assembly protein PilV
MLKKYINYFKREKGFTLIEVIIILIVITIVALPLSKLSVSNMKAVTNSYFTSEVYNYAEGSMEELIAAGRKQGWNSITSGYGFSFQVPTRLTRSLSVTTDSLNGVVYKRATVTIGRNELPDLNFTTILVR